MDTHELIHFVSNVEAATQWYAHKLGWPVVETADWGFAVLQPPGEGRLALMDVRNWKPGWQSGEPLPQPVLSIRSNDIEAAVAKLKENKVNVGFIIGEEDGIRACMFTDPEGNKFYLWSEGSKN